MDRRRRKNAILQAIPLPESRAPARPGGEAAPRPAIGARTQWQALFSLSRSIWLPVAAICLAAIGTFFFNEWSVGNISKRAEQVTSLMAMQNSLIEVRGRVVDAETGQRGFLLSGDPRYLEPYEAALKQLPIIGAQLRVQAGTDPGLLAQAQRLETLRGQKLSELRATVMLAQRGQRQDAITLLESGEGKASMDRFRRESQVLYDEFSSRIRELRQRTSYDVQFSRLAFGSLGLLTVVLLIVTVRLLLKDFHRQELAHHHEITERQRLEQVVAERTAELSELTTFLQRVSEQEKAELARELHDEMGGLLTAAKMDLAWLMGRASANEPEVRAKLDMLAADIEDAMSVKRRVTSSLRPALLDHFGLPTALRSYFEDTCKKAGLQCKSTLTEIFEDIPYDVGIALFRVAQESLTNIVRHARATTVDLSFDADELNYRIRISDDGIGIGQDPARTDGPRSHGIAGMRHRVTSLQGEFRIGVNQPRGTLVEVTVPRVRRAYA